jgi:predicted NUDIX family phosphoesterase/dephospho-CoA kinase
MGRPYTCLQAAYLVLEQAGKPMSVKEIRDEIIKNHIDLTKTGRTPDRTVNARISEDIKKNRKKSAFKRVGRGLYGLRSFKQDEFKSIDFNRRIFPGDQVLTIDTKLLNQIGNFHGISKDFENYSNSFFTWNNYQFIERLVAERSERVKQIVNYTMITYKNTILQYSRGEISNLSHKYLYGDYSIGFGGHIQLTDFDLFNEGIKGYLNGARREVEEETGIKIDSSDQPKIVGVLNDDSSALGRHHFAFIHMYEAKSPEYTKKEKSINQLRFVNISELGAEFAKYEYWSKLCILNYFSNYTTPACFIESKNNKLSLFQNKVLHIVGHIGSGKTEACSLLEKDFGYKSIKASNVLKKILGFSLEESVSREIMQNEGYKFIKSELGHEILAEEINKIIQSIPKQHWVIDGLRFPRTHEVLQKKYGHKIPIIYIESIVDNQYKYYLERERIIKSFEEYLKIVYHPVEKEIERFLHKADIVVYNHGSFDAYIDQLNHFFIEESKK